MITLRSDQLRERTTHVLVCFQLLEDGVEVISRCPAKVISRAFIGIYAVDTGKHSPLPAAIFGLILRHALSHYEGRVDAQLRQIAAAEWRRCAYDVLAKTGSGGLFCG